MAFVPIEDFKYITQFDKICIQNNHYGCFISDNGAYRSNDLYPYNFSIIGDSRIFFKGMHYTKLYEVKSHSEVKSFKDIASDELSVINEEGLKINPRKVEYGKPYRLCYQTDNRLLICTEEGEYTRRLHPDIFLVDIKKRKNYIQPNDKRLYWIFWPVQTSNASVESCYYNQMGLKGCTTGSTCVGKVLKYCDNESNFQSGLCKSIFFDYHNQLSGNLRVDELKKRQCRNLRKKEDSGESGSRFDFSICRCINAAERLTREAEEILARESMPPHCIFEECSSNPSRDFYRLAHMTNRQCPTTVCQIRKVISKDGRTINLVQDCVEAGDPKRNVPDKKPPENNEPDPEPDPKPENEGSNLNRNLLIATFVSMGLVVIVLIVILLRRRK